MEDQVLMRRALALAEMGWGQTAPNPMVGAVLVRDGVIVGEGLSRAYGGDHAEVAALHAPATAPAARRCTSRSNPARITGQTPPCADAVIAAGVQRVVIAVADPSPVARGGAERLQRAGHRRSRSVSRRPRRVSSTHHSSTPSPPIAPG